MSTSYPKVHVVGSGVYYAYRPITRLIEKVSRNHFRDCSSRPKEFSHYFAATSPHEDFRRHPGHSHHDHPRGSSLPPYDPRDQKRDSGRGHSRRETVEASASTQAHHASTHAHQASTHAHHASTHAHHARHAHHASDPSLFDLKPSEYLSQARSDAASAGLDDLILKQDRSALFTNASSEDTLTRLRRKHPYRLPVENEVVPPHESSIWPENRPHFDLVSSYDLMVDYLGIRDKSK